MLVHMLSMPGMAVSPVSRPARMRRRAISRLAQPRASRCWRSQVPSSVNTIVSFLLSGQARGMPGAGACPGLCVRRCAAVVWSGEQVVGQSGFGALDEGPDLVGLEDEGGA